jgi:hypothetical protein
MFAIHDHPYRLCDGLTRREWLRLGGISLGGLSLPALLQARQTPGSTGAATRPIGKAKACIVVFLTGGPSQHETWDPKPDAPAEIRGPFKSMASSVPGLSVGELMPRTAALAHHCAVLRAVSTGDNGHSSSGYAMFTGQAHQPFNLDFAKPGAPNDWPCLGAIVQDTRRKRGQAGVSRLPAAVALPYLLQAPGNPPWPGQTAGWLGPNSDPWLLTCDPNDAHFRVAGLDLPAEVPASRLDGRRSLLGQLDGRVPERTGGSKQYQLNRQLALDLLGSAKTMPSFNLDQEPVKVRERYGRHRFGQSLLLARRLVEAGVSLVQVNWPNIPDAGLTQEEGLGSWDTHAKHAKVVQSVLMPRLDQSYSALLEDLAQRGLLDETLVLWMGEFGRTPKFNAAGGRDHWGHVFSVALAGGGVRGGQVYGASDAQGAQPKAGPVKPQDLMATVLHCLGIPPESEIHDVFGRPLAISRGRVIQEIL